MSIGEALADSRREAGLSITDVSQRTRIRAAIITGIEGDDYSACGGDFYARGHIRSIARVVGTDPEPLIREYDTIQLGPPAVAEDDITEPVPAMRREWRWPDWGRPEWRRLEWRRPGWGRPGSRRPDWRAALVVALVLVLLGLLAYFLLAGSSHPAGRAASARTHPAAPHRAGHGGTAAAASPPSVVTSPVAGTSPAAGSPAAGSPAAGSPAQPLAPVSAAAFEPYGGQGDNGNLAHLAIDGSPATAWHTDWYTSARFGGLYPGTGLLVDMGKAVTITAARVTLGGTPGADFQLRVGTAPALADLPQVAAATDAGGAVNLRLASPARGRYVLLWFTSLPPDPAGSFEASVYDIRLQGQG